MRTWDDTFHVALVGPPLGDSGGIGRVMGYALDALAERPVVVEVLDARGRRHSPWSSVGPLARTCVALVRLRRRNEVDLVHVNISSHGSTLRKGIVVRWCRLLRLPTVLHLHASSFPEFFDQLPRVARGWVRRTFGVVDRVIVLSEVWRRYVVDVLGVDPRSVSVLGNATPSALPVEGDRAASAARHVVFLGRLGTRKGVPELLEALADERFSTMRWRATLAGDGDVDGYRRRAIELGLGDRISFPGWVGTTSVAALLAQADVLALPSRAEGMPMSVLEAFSAGVPVVCTDVGGLPEVVLDDVNGVLVPPGEAAPLADALHRLLSDDELRVRLGRGARATWHDHHAIAGYADRLVEEWQHAAAGRDLARTDHLPLGG